MRHPRLTTRRLMVIVAAVAVGIQAARLWKVSELYRQRATDNAESARLLRGAIRDNDAEQVVEKNMSQTVLKRLEAIIRQEIPLRAAMACKYDHAARYPWLPVAPDPLPPDQPSLIMWP
jgi:hypothetical protein